jgi:GNAT superfamily N-acetyltransferase
MSAHTATLPAPRTATVADIPQLLTLSDVLVDFDRQFDPSLDPLYNRSEAGLAWLRETLEDPSACVFAVDAPTVATATGVARAVAARAKARELSGGGDGDGGGGGGGGGGDGSDSGSSGRLAGMLFGRVEAAEPWRLTGGPLAELEMLCVAPEFRGAGAGKLLAEAFEAWARGRGAVRLWVRVSAANAGALRFYKRGGFADYDTILERDLSASS